MIVSGGENVYPVEVEEVLSQHPAVAEVAVIGVPDERWGETVKALVVPSPGAGVDADELVAFARERLAGYKLPRSVDFVASFLAAPRERSSSASCAPVTRRPPRLPLRLRNQEADQLPARVGHSGGGGVGSRRQMSDLTSVHLLC